MRAKIFRTSFLLIFAMSILGFAPRAHAINFKPIMVATTYGVLAGTLTGVGSLAFYETPSDNLRNVAIGASTGLYLGVLIGLYATYLAPAFQGGGSKSDPDNPINLKSQWELSPLLDLAKFERPRAGIQFKF